MYTDPNSYGTGKDPRRRASHLIPVLLLLLSCVTIHALTLLYLSNREDPPKEDHKGLSMEELPTEEAQSTATLRDNCGLGLELSDISEVQQRYWSLPDGVFVEQIETDSAAYAAGLRSGDLLLEIEDQTVSAPEDCLELLEEHCEEASLELVYYRDGKEYSLRIPLEEAGQ